jgi:nucleoside-diphosphate-sugar epimerase
MASIEKARRELGWEPRISLEEGLRLTVEWYRRGGLTR